MNIMCGGVGENRRKGRFFIKGVSMREPGGGQALYRFFTPETTLYNDLTVEEFLAFTANIRRIPTGEVAEAIKVVMGRCGLSHFHSSWCVIYREGYQ